MSPIKIILDLFPGWGAYVAGIGAIGLGVYLITEGKLAEGWAALMAGFAAIRARRAVSR